MLNRLVSHYKFWSSTEGSFLISGIRPSKSSCVISFCTNSSTFLMSVDPKVFTVFEVAWLLSCVHLCRHCHLCSQEIRGTGQKGFSKGFSYCRAKAFWCQRHHLTQFPSCLFSICPRGITVLFVRQKSRVTACLIACSLCYYCPQNLTNYNDL